MITVLVSLNGVVRADTGRVIDEGKRLVQALSSTYRVVLGLDNADMEYAKRWLAKEHVTGHTEVLPSMVPSAMRGMDSLLAQIENLKGRGYEVGLVIDNDPSRVAQVLRLGTNGLLFVDAKYSRPEFRPDFEGRVKPWDEIVSEIEKQHSLATGADES